MPRRRKPQPAELAQLGVLPEARAVGLAKLQALTRRRKRLDARQASDRAQVDALNQQIIALMKAAGFCSNGAGPRALRAGEFRVTLMRKRGRSYINRQLLMECGVRPDVILASTVRKDAFETVRISTLRAKKQEGPQ